jgi:hypothetical protein
MERDLEAGRLYADVNIENAQAATIVALSADLENTLTLVQGNSDTIEALQQQLTTAGEASDTQGFLVDQTLDRVTCRFDGHCKPLSKHSTDDIFSLTGVQVMLERLRKVLAQVGWSAAAAALGEDDAPDPQLNGLAGAIEKLESLLISTKADIQSELTCIKQNSENVDERLNHVEDNPLLTTLLADFETLQNDVHTQDLSI